MQLLCKAFHLVRVHILSFPPTSDELISYLFLTVLLEEDEEIHVHSVKNIRRTTHTHTIKTNNIQQTLPISKDKGYLLYIAGLGNESKCKWVQNEC